MLLIPRNHCAIWLVQIKRKIKINSLFCFQEFGGVRKRDKQNCCKPQIAQNIDFGVQKPNYYQTSDQNMIYEKS